MALIRTKQLQLLFEGNITISGSLNVLGNTTFTQSSSNIPALTVSGSEVIVASNFSGSKVSASLTIQNLGTLADTGSNAIIDLGNESF